MDKITARSPEEVIALVPHLLGFHPEESLVIVGPGGMPTARIDLPHSQAELDDMAGSVQQTYATAAHTVDVAHAQVVLVTVSEDLTLSETASRAMADGLAEVGVATVLQLWSNGDQWINLDTGMGGDHSPAVVSQIAAARVAAGRAQPMSSRDQLAADLVGDREPVAALLPAARAVAADRDRRLGRAGRAEDQHWAVGKYEAFVVDGDRLSDPDAARLLVALEDKPTRDTLWWKVDRGNAESSSALWADLTRRAPDEVRAAPATLLAFSSWLNGDGARAWCALDQVPTGQPYSMAALVDTVLQEGINPREWDKLRETDTFRDLTQQPADPADAKSSTVGRTRAVDPMVDESYVPAPRNRADNRPHSRSAGRPRPHPGHDPGPASPAR